MAVVKIESRIRARVDGARLATKRGRWFKKRRSSNHEIEASEGLESGSDVSC